MKAYQTCVHADDLISDIKAVVRSSSEGKPKSFSDDLQKRLRKETLDEIRSGKMDSYRFEHLIKSILDSLGANETTIIPRQNDKGADLVASFIIANTSKLVVAVQAKHFSPKPPVGPNVVDQLLGGMEAESADIGWIVTSGTFSKEAIKYVEQLHTDRGIRIDLIDGDQLASLLLEAGFKNI
jgi:restriction system protein